jgi:hypothetical protein
MWACRQQVARDREAAHAPRGAGRERRLCDATQGPRCTMRRTETGAAPTPIRSVGTEVGVSVTRGAATVRDRPSILVSSLVAGC